MHDLTDRRISLARNVQRLVVAVLCCGTILAGMTACGGVSRPDSGPQTPDHDGSVPPSSAPVSSGSAQVDSAADEPAAKPGCRHGRVELSYRVGGAQPGRVCVRAGTELVINLHNTPGYTWTAVESLSPHVVTVLRSGHGASATATMRVAKTGEAELRWTSSFTGDRFGPPTLLWRLKVTVVR